MKTLPLRSQAAMPFTVWSWAAIAVRLPPDWHESEVSLANKGVGQTQVCDAYVVAVGVVAKVHGSRDITARQDVIARIDRNGIDRSGRPVEPQPWAAM